MDKKSQTLLDKYAKRLGSTGKDRNLYLRYNREFLEYADNNFERETIIKFVEKLKRAHYSDGTINLRFRMIRTLYARNEMEWPFAQGEAPKIREDNIQAPALHPNKIQQLIEAIKKEGEPDEQAFFALSTTYGLRRIEMIELSQRDIRIKDQTIHISTAKHGRERTHIIPNQIVPYLETWDFNTRTSEFGLFLLWYRLENRIGMKHIPKVGFHSIRRTLDTLLAKKLSPLTVKSFLRHKQRTSTDMTYRYSAIKFVGEDEDTVEVIGDALVSDKDVFADGVHPFIDYWR